jgi:hypothetical protein
MVGGLLSRHNKTKVEVWCYANGLRIKSNDDGDGGVHYRQVTEEQCDHFIDVKDLTARETAAKVGPLLHYRCCTIIVRLYVLVLSHSSSVVIHTRRYMFG